MSDEVVEIGAYAQQKEATARAVNEAARMAQIAAKRTRELAALRQSLREMAEGDLWEHADAIYALVGRSDR